ncbi:hypothetical protein CQW23_01751 [Capsicum baccatum]|uniref:Uncharacterized protein n=1 Tax=Capsicum baccatum TaxID=33114 RepID=A0A2G2XPH5_CAPBA|nr:hypothetical protein CQW23_01751 [Capsicum baccatum]
MSVLYHPDKTNVVVDALSRLSMGSVCHVKDDKKELVRKVAMLGVRLVDSIEDKHKHLRDQHCEFLDLDSISIDNAIFEDSVAGSTMALADLAHPWMEQIINVQMSPMILFSLYNRVPKILNHKRLFRLSNCLIFLEYGVPCVTVLHNSPSSPQKPQGVGERCCSDSLRVQEVNIIDLFSLEVLLYDFFNKHEDYDVAKFSSPQKITGDSHRELLSAAQEHLYTINEDKVKIDKHLGDLQKVHVRAEKELEAWAFKKKNYFIY